MTEITQLFFDLHGTLIDSQEVLPPCYARALGEVMAARFGGDAATWAAANAQIVADWDSYYADLNFSAEDGIDQMWEGETRRIRAMFRLTGQSLPSPQRLRGFIREHSYLVTSQCDALYPDARAVLTELRTFPGLTLGVISNGLNGHVAGCLAGAGVRDAFTGPIITPEEAGYFPKDEAYFKLACARAGVEAAACVSVDDRVGAAKLAVRVGMRAVLLNRNERHGPLTGDGQTVVLTDLHGLPDVLRGWREETA